MPILDDNKKCLGVVQCINKLNGSIFSKQDEVILYYIMSYNMQTFYFFFYDLFLDLDIYPHSVFANNNYDNTFLEIN